MGKKKNKKAYRSPIESLPTVSYRQLVVSFKDRTVVIDNRTIRIDSDAVAIPILSGDAVFLVEGGERIG